MKSLQTVTHNGATFKFLAVTGTLIKVIQAFDTIFLTTEGEAFDENGKPFKSEVRLHGDSLWGCQIKVAVRDGVAEISKKGVLTVGGLSFRGAITLLIFEEVKWINVEVLI